MRDRIALIKWATAPSLVRLHIPNSQNGAIDRTDDLIGQPLSPQSRLPLIDALCAVAANVASLAAAELLYRLVESPAVALATRIGRSRLAHVLSRHM